MKRAGFDGWLDTNNDLTWSGAARLAPVARAHVVILPLRLGEDVATTPQTLTPWHSAALTSVTTVRALAAETVEITTAITDAGANARYGSIPTLAAYLRKDGLHWAGRTLSVNLGNLDNDERFLAINALTMWRAVAGITFTYTTGSANIDFNHNGTHIAQTNRTVGGGGVLSHATVQISSDFNYGVNGIHTYMFQTYLHEIGHALGLGHQGPYNGEGSYYGIDNVFTNDTWQFSVMSYFFQSHFGGASYAYTMTPQMADIYAIQSLYGAPTTRADDTIYGFNSTAGALYDLAQYLDFNSIPAFTIYDSGGIDTLDVSGYSANQVIDLTPGAWSSIGGKVNNIAIYLTTTIENAIGGTGNDTLTGNSADNRLTGGDGSDIMNGGAGADTMDGGAGDDLYTVDNAGDIVIEAAGAGHEEVRSSVTYILADTLESLTLTGTGAIDGTGNAQNNSLVGNAGANILTGKGGDDTYYVQGAADTVVELAGEGHDIVYASGSFALGNNVEDLNLASAISDADGTGNGLANIITGSDGNNSLTGAAGNDTLYGDFSLPYDASWVIDNGYGHTTIATAALIGAAAFDLRPDATIAQSTTVLHATIAGTGVGDYRVYSFKVDKAGVIGTFDIDAAGPWWDSLLNLYDAVGTLLATGDESDPTDGGGGSDTGSDAFIRYTFLAAGTYYLQLAATDGTTPSGIPSGESYQLNLSLDGNTVLSPLLVGGADRLDGGSGADSMAGGNGNDTYVVDNAADITFETAGQGDSDLVESGLSWTLADNIENLTLTGTVNINGTGNGGDNIVLGNTGRNLLKGLAGNDYLFGDGGTDSLSGGDGDDFLDGGTGADTMLGGLGSDTYTVDDAGDVVTEAANAGTSDYVRSSISYTLGANLERLELLGADDLSGTGNALNNYIQGNDGANTLNGMAGDDELDGGLGADMLIGGTGNDTYYVDTAGDAIIEAAGGGTDLVISDITWTLASEVENLTLLGSDNINGIGNGSSNVLLGSDGNNALMGLGGHDRLDGGAGADTLTGGTGDDTYVIDNAGDVVTEAAGEGTDTVIALRSWTLSANVEILILSSSANLTGTGNALANTLTGNGGNDLLSGLAGNDRLDGGSGADTMVGGLGDDTFVVDTTADVVTEAAGEGTDTVLAKAAFTLGANVENLMVISNTGIAATGNALANQMTGADGNDVLDGGAGADTLTGGLGADIYVIDDSNDVIIEAANAGWDQVVASASLILSANVEAVTLTGSAAINATGNALGNLMLGNAGANTLSGLDGNDDIDGGLGADTLIGGSGNDIYTVDNAGDAIVELSGGGTDLVQASVSYTLLANVEKLTLTSNANLTGTGNSAANTISAGGGDNVLDGRTGADLMSGGTGNDTYYVDNTGDTVIEYAGEGSDLIITTLTWILGAELENLTLGGTAAIDGTGNALANALTGNTGNNLLDGGLGADTLTGGAGNDTFVVDNTGDLIVELSGGGGIDLVQASVSYTLLANIENLTLTGAANLSATGNSIANTLTGNTGNNLLDGRAGADTMTGGSGNDTYVVDNAGDVIVELSGGGGTDLVQASVTLTLAANIEKLTLTGAESLSGTGNSSANTLLGNTANNVLDGRAGNDLLNGYGGNDTLFGGAGADTFIFLAASGADAINDFSAVDNDLININAYSHGVVNGGGVVISQSGANALIDLGGGNVITVLATLATDAAFLSHIVW